MKALNKLILLFLIPVFVFGGLGVLVYESYMLGFLIILFLSVLFFAKSDFVKLPEGSLLYGLFLLTLIIGIFWAEDKLIHFQMLTLFIGGGLLWVIFYNGQTLNESNSEFNFLISGLGIVFLVISLYIILIGDTSPQTLSLIRSSNIKYSHYHLGDFWALLSIVFVSLIYKKKTNLYLLLCIPAFIILTFSNSRSAYLSLLFGICYFFMASKNQLFSLKKKYILIFCSLITALFIFSGTFKNTLTDRPYVIQAAQGLIKYPYGVGMGNFRLISAEFAPVFADDYSVLTDFSHNLILEIFSGVGFFGLVFVFWVILIFRIMYFRKDQTKNVLYKSLFLALSVNFMFDVTYFIPTMFWLWFSLLGLSMRKSP